MRAFIYVGGEIFTEGILDTPKKGDIKISADCGYKNAQQLGVTVDFAVGDFDSGSKHEIPHDAELIEVPPEKDFSDTQLAVDLALKEGAESVYIVGGLGGRLDHTLANLGILEELWARGIRAYICDGKNRVRYIERTTELVPKNIFRYLSVICADKEAKGVTIEGCKYPLKNARLTRANNSFSTSNEILKNCALVSVKKGGIYIIESNG